MSRTPQTLPLILLALIASAAPARAQAAGEWNSRRALELIGRARERRARPPQDSALRNYEALAHGYVYFYLDRKDTEERTLVKVDQLALEVYWGTPDRTKQRIVGRREKKTLPNNMRYHLDHLTVVQNEFDDRIRLGDGDEVRDVLHPAARGAASVYDFRLADSLTLRLGGAPDPIRVYEIEVRPRRLDRPALIGSIFLDRESADIVRMVFTFTPASYVDPRLDYIRVSLDNGLWEGRYWLPYEQQIEIRRQVPELDFPAGGVIRGTMRLGDYRFNQDLPPGFFRGARVVALPRRLRESYDFERDLFADLDELGLSPTPDLAGLRRQVIAMIGRRQLSGLPRLRLYIPNASSILRYNRAESFYLGGGLSYVPGPDLRLDGSFGHASGAGHFAGTLAARFDPGDHTTVRLRGERNATRDIGLRPAIAGVLNTLSAMTAGKDFTDPYYADGVSVAVEHRLGGTWRTDLGLGYESHHSATLAEPAAVLDENAPFRPVLPIADGRLLASRLALRRSGPAASAAGWNTTLAIEAGRLAGASYVRSTLEVEARRESTDRRTAAVARTAAGFATGHTPPQRLFLLGGRGTIPGYAFHSFVGDRFALANIEISRQLVGPWVRLRALGALGWTDLAGATAPAGWTAHASNGLRVSAGLGIGLVYDVLRIDWARPLDTHGGWATIISVTPHLRDIL